MFEYLVCWLITFGFAFSMALTDGPWGLFKRNRQFFKLRLPKDHWIVIGVQCPICLSFYIGLIATLSLGGGASMWLSSFGFVAVVTSLSPDSPE